MPSLTHYPYPLNPLPPPLLDNPTTPLPPDQHTTIILLSTIHKQTTDSFGNQSKPQIHDMRADRDGPYAVTSSFSIHNKTVNPLWSWTSVPSVPVT